MCGTDDDCGCGCGEQESATPIGRRRFLQSLLGAGGAGLAAGAGLFSSRAYGAQANLIGAAWSGAGDCFDHSIEGLCFGGFPPVPTGFRVRHYLPVAIVECTSSPTDSVIVGGDSASMNGLRKLNTSGANKEAGFSVNVWSINDYVRDLMTYGLSRCGWCDSGDARNSAGRGGSIQQGFSQVEDALGCGLGLGSITGALSNLTGGIFPLAYSTGIDQAHWTTGCRDTFESSVRAPLTLPMCTVDPPEAINDFTESLDIPVGGFSRNDVCIGELGPLYPRQMTARSNSDANSALVTAWRALHLSYFGVGSFPYNVDPDDNKWQTLYPNVGGSCFRLDEDLESLEQKIGTSSDGKYAFIYWTPVRCCIDFAEYSCTVATG